jgi:2-oxoisovalerate dehydrogenase E1 component
MDIGGQVIDRLELLRLMLEIREGDLREGKLFRQGQGWIHIPGAGHEPLAGLALLLKPDDLIFGYYRDRALYRGRGVTSLDLAREHLATATSRSGGRMMPVHGSYRQLGIFPPVTPTGAQCLPAVGAAWRLKQTGTGAVALTTIGDASARQGEFYEAVAFAVERRLPVLFIVEDNGFGISTRTATQLPFRLGIFGAELFRHVDGRDVDLLLAAGAEAIGDVRAGGGPRILWCEFDRLASHTNSDDHRVYRPADEIGAMEKRDPVARFAERLIGEGRASEAAVRRMKEEAAIVVGEAYDAAEREAAPDPASANTHLFAPRGKAFHAPPVAADGAEWTMVAAFRKVLRESLARHPAAMIFGEDVEDPKGGVFGFTQGLSTEFPGRVVNAPLAEATIVGVGTGYAAAGGRPIFELQFIDFLAPAFNQLLNQVATLRWRSNGEWSSPAIFYAPYGAYLPAGSTWHSQSNEGIWAHIPGLRIAIPSSPEDIAGLFWTAMNEDDPTLFLIPKHVMRVRHEAPRFAPVPFGRARTVRTGGDVTLVTWGNGVELAEAVAAELAGEASVEVIDLRTIVPCDHEAVAASLARTGRLVVVTEDAVTCSFGQAVVAEVCARPERFNLLLSAPALVAREDAHIPYHPILEAAILPDHAKVAAAVRAVMR